MSLECALMSEEFLTLEVCCCDMQAHSDGGGMSLVLASLSSALCIYNSEFCDTKKCPVVVLRPLWPDSRFQKDVAKI